MEIKWCPQHGYPTPCYKCGYSGEFNMKKADVQVLWDLYFKTSEEAYKTNRYVVLDKKGFKPEETELKKIIKQRVEGVDSLCHEMNRLMLSKLMGLRDKAEE
jgi:hypothetical protein